MPRALISGYMVTPVVHVLDDDDVLSPPIPGVRPQVVAAKDWPNVIDRLAATEEQLKQAALVMWRHDQEVAEAEAEPSDTST